MKMKNPSHLGRIIKDGYLAPLGLTVTDAAQARKHEDEIDVERYEHSQL